ncbi:MAG: iron ABC transporter permease [Chloroflexota bacterium]|nr:iron ABC transporter permease [Chloroflexota bacterium]MDE3193887.1 iron ABC transporter permease [Chloroflexota bacterium]
MATLTQALARRAVWRWPRLDALVLGAAILLLLYLTVVPLIFLVLGSLSPSGQVLEGGLTLVHLARVLTDRDGLGLLGVTVVYAVLTALLALAIGTAMAWVVERTDVPLRPLWYAVALVPLIVPGIVNSIAWLFLLSPTIGWLNLPLRALFGVSLSIYSLPGMVWVEALHEAPLAFVLAGAAFRSMDPALEEAAATSGASMWTTVRRVDLPLLFPVASSVLLILFVRTLQGFEVPAIIGLPAQIYVYTSRIYLALTDFPPDFGLSAAFALVLLAIATVGVLLQRRLTRRSASYATVSGKAYRPRRLELGRYRGAAFLLLGGYGLFAVVLPFLVLVWSSLLSYYSVPTATALRQFTLANYLFVVQDDLTRVSLLNSLELSVGAATSVMLLTGVIGWITVRGRSRARIILDVLAFIPLTIPGIVLGVSLIWVYFTLPIAIYGTMWILLIAYTTNFLPYGIRTVTSALVRLQAELEEAAQTAGASWVGTLRRITLPLLRPSLLAGWIYVFIVSLRELGASILLYSTKSEVLAVRIFDLRDAGQYTVIAALSVILVVFLVILVAALQSFFGRVPAEA